MASKGKGGEYSLEDGLVVWLTGAPCSGKSSIAEALASRLRARGGRVQVLDADVVRPHLSPELGYSRADRERNVLRIAYVANLLMQHGVVVIVAAVSPFESVRAEVRRRIPRYFEVHVGCPLQECERRDTKGMYARARRGELPDFTGVSSPYEVPTSPELRLDTLEKSLDDSVSLLLSRLLGG